MISDPTQQNQWWLIEGGQPSGPFTGAELSSRLGNGKLSGDTLACPGGGTEWRPLSRWPQFFANAPSAIPLSPSRAGHGSLSPYVSPAATDERWQSPERRHSGVGIASFITSVISGLAIFGLVVAAGVLEETTPGGVDEESVAAIVLGLFLLAFCFTSFIALGLGIGGCFHKNRKKVFAVLGTLFSALTLIGIVSIIALGMSM